MKIVLHCVSFYICLYVHLPACLFLSGAGRSSEVECSLMVRWVVGSILHGVDLLSYFSFQPVLYNWCNKGRGMCYPVCGMMHIKERLLLIDKSSLCGGSGFPFLLSEWSLTICLMPYNRRKNLLSASLNKTFPSFLPIHLSLYNTYTVRCITDKCNNEKYVVIMAVEATKPLPSPDS